MGAMLNPRFQQAMTAFQPPWTQGRDQDELPPDAFTCQLEQALEVLEAEGGPAPEDDGRTLEEMVEQLGFSDITDEQRSAVRSAPEMIEKLVAGMEQGLAREKERHRAAPEGDEEG